MHRGIAKQNVNANTHEILHALDILHVSNKFSTAKAVKRVQDDVSCVKLCRNDVKIDEKRVKTEKHKTYLSPFSFPLFSLSRPAMTLAEVLITLAIIGVVAAMTLPNLINNIQDAQFKTAWKKEYSVINQAYTQMKYDNGNDLSEWLDRPTGNYWPDPFLDQFSTYFSTIKKCLPITMEVYRICGTKSLILDNSYKTLSGGYVLQPQFTYGNILLSDGTHLFFRTYSKNQFVVWVDVNGFNKNPNTLGRDLFALYITKNKIIPFGAAGTKLQNTCNSTPISSAGISGLHGASDLAGAGCSAEVLYK